MTYFSDATISSRPKALLSCSSIDHPTTPQKSKTALAILAKNAMDRLDRAGIDATLIEDLHLKTTPQAALDGRDILIVLGGGDVDPQVYSREKGASTICGSDPVADEFEVSLIQHAIASRKIVLGICRGMQLLNVARGGTLIQELGPDGAHYVTADQTSFVEHTVRIEDKSRIAAIFETSEIKIHSAHHQAVEHLGQGLLASATAVDGVVEAIELEGDNLVLGVQWHPEAVNADQRQLDLLFSAMAVAHSSRIAS
jgi:putative glutamine amidotransferase